LTGKNNQDDYPQPLHPALIYAQIDELIREADKDGDGQIGELFRFDTFTYI
jgi:hypothetical protein